jgi:cysteine sulfinate desulfinase/cysteine desulfurase-like protein
VLEERILDLERQHRLATVNLIAARATAEAAAEDSTQRDRSLREVENLEDNIATYEAALVALNAQEKAELPNRAARRAHGNAKVADGATK